MTSRRLTRRGRVILGSVAALLGGAALAYFASLYEPLYSSPEAQRENDAYRWTLDAEPAPPDDMQAFFESLTIQEDAANPQVAYVDKRRHRGDALNHVARVAKNGRSVDLPGGQVTLEGIGVAYCRAKPARTNAFELPAEVAYFGPDMNPLRKPPTWTELPGDSLGFHGRFPRARLLFRIPELAGMKTMRARLFDARTHATVSNQHEWERVGDTRYRIDLDWQMWHSAPTKLAWELAHGSPKTVTLPVKAGEMATFEQGAIKLLLVLDEGYRGLNQHRRSQAQLHMAQLRPDPSSKGESSTLVFACYPQAYPLPVEWELLDEDGNVLRHRNSAAAGRLKIVSLSHPPAKIDAIRLRIYPEMSRLIFSFPRLPGLPEANREVSNLFDVTMPYVRFEAAFELRNTVERSLQMRIFPSRRARFPPAYFPREFVDATPRQLLSEYLTYCPPPKHLRLDYSKQRIYIGKGPIERLLDDIRKYVR